MENQAVRSNDFGQKKELVTGRSQKSKKI